MEDQTNMVDEESVNTSSKSVSVGWPLPHIVSDLGIVGQQPGPEWIAGLAADAAALSCVKYSLGVLSLALSKTAQSSNRWWRKPALRCKLAYVVSRNYTRDRRGLEVMSVARSRRVCRRIFQQTKLVIHSWTHVPCCYRASMQFLHDDLSLSVWQQTDVF